MTILATTEGEKTPDTAITKGYELAQQYEDELIVLNVLPQDTYEERWEERPGYVADDGREDAEQTAQNTVDGTLDDYENVSIVGRIGDPVDEIIELAESVDARFIVIAGRKRSPVGKAIFGSNTQSLILNTGRPVVVVGID